MDNIDITELVELVREKLVPFCQCITNHTDAGCVKFQLTINIQKPEELKHIISQLNKI